MGEMGRMGESRCFILNYTSCPLPLARSGLGWGSFWAIATSLTVYRLSACIEADANLFFRDLDLATSRTPHSLILPEVDLATSGGPHPNPDLAKGRGQDV
ncbi:hypothetical protein Oscil6304_0201 [Oscillatoria acuminata PCC 6304]|uniref:Uncharacterized protein n=1 Tax=Oscillatoria acuminata PCC 6304 TaxID=56110 RepID=K9TD67_9CYAN|nr:hypothetical protein Oscil6304_0201 [Oscillatoria acuminata PCC 6304]